MASTLGIQPMASTLGLSGAGAEGAWPRLPRFDPPALDRLSSHVALHVVKTNSETSNLTRLSQSNGPSEQGIMQTDALTTETRTRAQLAACVDELEKKVASMMPLPSKRKTKRDIPRARKARIRRRTVQDLSAINGSRTPCIQFVQNNDTSFLTHNLCVHNSHGCSGVVNPVYVSMSINLNVLEDSKAGCELGINPTGRSHINTVRSALAWASEKAVKYILPQFLTRGISHFSGGA